uniref:Uncharacterized protein n=1 Tax=Glossina austeni TaxID=7395 RepID=A0A1A9VXM5_GLOAU
MESSMESRREIVKRGEFLKVDQLEARIILSQIFLLPTECLTCVRICILPNLEKVNAYLITYLFYSLTNAGNGLLTAVTVISFKDSNLLDSIEYIEATS